MNGRTQYRVGVGTSSILMIFAILCLTTLGVLAFASGRADLALTERRTRHVETYYQASTEAQEVLQAIDALLLSYEGRAALGDVAYVTAYDADELTIRVPVGDSQTLCMQLALHAPNAAARYTITRYEVVFTGEWSNESNLFDANAVMPEG